MTDLNEIIVDWTSENSQPGLSVMYCKASGPVAAQRSYIHVMYDTVKARLDSLTTWTIRTTGKVIDDSTGTLVGFWDEPTAKAGAGTLSGSPVANAAQMLLRWRTTSIVNGRLLQGRTYVPGLSSTSTDGGQVSAATIAAMQTAQAAFLSSMSGDFVVWHRPVGAAPGSSFSVSSGATWNELATQRRRR